LLFIEELKSKGASNEEISKKLEVKNKREEIIASLKSPEFRKHLITYASLILLILIFINELGIINLGKSKNITSQNPENVFEYQQIYGSGTAFVPKSQKKSFCSF